MAELQILKVSDLLSVSSPLTGTNSLSISHNPLKKHKSLLSPQIIETNHLNNLFFTPLKSPSILTGTIDLPANPSDNFLSFQDNSSRISCVVLNFDLSLIGSKVQILAWNFLPSTHPNEGLLEVIRWSAFETLKELSILSLRKGPDSSR